MLGQVFGNASYQIGLAHTQNNSYERVATGEQQKPWIDALNEGQGKRLWHSQLVVVVGGTNFYSVFHK
jgi:hypothetical protein